MINFIDQKAMELSNSLDFPFRFSLLKNLEKSPRSALIQHKFGESPYCFTFGSAFHQKLLFPYETSPYFTSGARSKEEKNFIASKGGDFRLRKDDDKLIDAMYHSVYANNFANTLLSHVPSLKEQQLFWFDKETGIPCRGKFDLLLLDETAGGENEGIYANLVDLKSTDSPYPEDFVWSTRKFKYHAQLAMYGDALETFNIHVKRFFIIAVEKSLSPECIVFEVPLNNAELSIENGRKYYRSLALKYKEIMSMDNWEQGYPEDIYLLP